MNLWPRRPPRPVVPPEGVRVVYEDGSEVLAVIHYLGRDDRGIDQWEAVVANPYGAVGMRADKLPARTGILIGPIARG